MGIRSKENIIIKSQDEFYAIDKIVTGYAFDIHNNLGRFGDEKIYQEVMAEKCRDAYINCKCEVEICVTYKDFIKVYRLDLLVDNGVIYEIKTVKSLNDFHKQQLINYLLLTGIKHGKLLNFRTSSVEYEFVSTTLSYVDRRNYFINIKEWYEVTKNCKKLRCILDELLKEWQQLFFIMRE